MSLLNRLRPKWQNSDPDVRVEAVRQLGKEEAELLTAVAQGDPDARVRQAAVKKIDAPRLLLEIAETDDDERVRRFAQQRARQLLVQIACDSRDASESARALELLSDAPEIVLVADKAHFDDVRAAAFDALTDDTALVELVRKTKDPDLRTRALDRIQEPGSLKSIVLDEASGDLASTAIARIDDIETLESIASHGGAAKPARRQALAKLSQLVPDDHPIKVQERDDRFSDLCHRAEQIADRIDATDGAAIETLAELESSWSELENVGSASEALAQRFRTAADRIRELRNKAAAREDQPAPDRDTPEKAEEASTAGESRSEHDAILDSLSGVGDDGLAEALAAARERWERLGKAEPKLERRFGAASAKVEGRIDQLAKVAARKDELRQLLEEVEAKSRGDDDAAAALAFSKLQKKWRTLESIADAGAKTRYAHLEERAHEVQEKKRREQEAEEQKTLSEIQTHLAKLAELTAAEDLSIKEADKELRAVADLLKNMGPLARSINRKKMRRELTEAREKLYKKTQDTRTIEDWKRWANADIQNGLISRIEALRHSPDLPKIAKELRAIHEEWKKAGAAPAEKAEELWQRYKSLRDELKARCDEFFEKQNKERLQNLKEKETLCVEVEALADSEDWNATAEAIKLLQEKWKTIGPAPQKQSDAVWKRFRKACDRFFERRKDHFGELKGERDENLKKKEALCEQAEALRDSTDWRNTADQLKKLQTEWRTIGAVPRKKSDQVWKRFRKACDHFFDRYKRRDEVELEEQLKKREALVEEAAAFAREMPDDAAAVAAKAKELWSTWTGLGIVPESRRELQERFESILSELVSGAPDAFANTDLDPATSRKKRERLVTRLESLVSDFTVPDQAEHLDELEMLAQRLKDALATNTMTGSRNRERKPDWRAASEEVRRLRTNWFRIAPVPGDEGRALGERFHSAYRSFLEQKPQAKSS